MKDKVQPHLSTLEDIIFTTATMKNKRRIHPRQLVEPYIQPTRYSWLINYIHIYLVNYLTNLTYWFWLIINYIYYRLWEAKDHPHWRHTHMQTLIINDLIRNGLKLIMWFQIIGHCNYMSMMSIQKLRKPYHMKNNDWINDTSTYWISWREPSIK